MSRWFELIKKGCLFLGLIGLLGWSGDVGANPVELSQLEQKMARKSRYVQALYRLRQKQIAEVEEAARRLAFVKEQAQRSGILGLPARMRLPSERAAAESLVRKIERLDRRLLVQNQRLQAMRAQLGAAYRKQLQLWKKRLAMVLPPVEREKIRKQWKVYYQRLEALNRSSSRMDLRRVPRLEVKMDPLDGPEDLKQKADILKDQEDRLKQQIAEVRMRITRLRRQEQRERGEQRLEQRVGEMLAEDELFNEGERNPRVTTGSKTSERLRNRSNANAARLFGASGKTGTTAATPNAGSNTATEAANKTPDRSTTPPPQGAAPGGSGVQGAATDTNKAAGSNTGTTGNPAGTGTADPKAGFSQDNGSKTDTTSGTTTSGTAVNPVTPSATLQPRLGTSRVIVSGDPTNPQGSLAYQLKVLQEYRKDLLKQVKDLRKKHQQFLQRARTLKQQETRKHPR